MIPRPIVFFDLETAGLEPADEIIQLSAVAVDVPSWEERSSFNRLIQFDVERANPRALEINHYDPAIWEASAVPMRQALQEFSYWLNNFKSVPMVSKSGKAYRIAQMAGYNSESFDQSRLQAAFKDQGMFYPAHYRTLDVLQLAAWNGLAQGQVCPPLKLEDVCLRLGIDTSMAHDALADVRMTIEVAKRILKFPVAIY